MLCVVFEYRAYSYICLIVECSCLFSSFICTNDFPLNKNHIKSHMVSPVTRLLSFILACYLYIIYNICFKLLKLMKTVPFFLIIDIVSKFDNI